MFLKQSTLGQYLISAILIYLACLWRHMKEAIHKACGCTTSCVYYRKTLTTDYQAIKVNSYRLQVGLQICSRIESRRGKREIALTAGQEGVR